MIGIACLMGTNLTSEWATADFLPSQILQALGQSFALTSLIVLVIKSISPADALTIGSLLQMSRLFGGEIGTSFMQTFVRVREQVHSNLIGLHVESSSVMTTDRLTDLPEFLGANSADHALTAGRATKLLSSAVGQQAAVYSYIDGFLAAAAARPFACFLSRPFNAEKSGVLKSTAGSGRVFAFERFELRNRLLPKPLRIDLPGLCNRNHRRRDAGSALLVGSVYPEFPADKVECRL